MDKAAPDPLQLIRNRIDAIDEAMHRLLIERSGVIDELIRVKGTSKPASAFRPDREADMMRRLVMRHEGNLPLASVEHIWREIITTFTAMQAPFSIAVGPAADPLLMRDVIRFYFGFSIPVANWPTGEAAIEAARAPARALAVVSAETPGRWWAGLAGPQAPKIFAKLPFLEMPSRPADLPAYVIGPPLRDCAPPDIRLYATADHAGTAVALQAYGGRVVGRSTGEMLVELPGAVTPEIIRSASGESFEATEVGGFAQPIRFVAHRAGGR